MLLVFRSVVCVVVRCCVLVSSVGLVLWFVAIRCVCVCLLC